MRRTTFALSLAASAALVAGSAIASDGGRKLQTSLTGAAEAPGPGDPDGRGTAAVTVNSGKRQICYTLSVRNITPATAAHIHEAAPGVAGPVKVTLRAPTNGRSSGCVTVTRELALDILKDPGDYYVNVHNAAFPKGAVRGQLAK
ncbi:MAG TPA: CHRD domain-containing protein [Sphingomicrobium sp.]|nr:CHRD domain-containing protein [Sphingomicrobium sp.]